MSQNEQGPTYRATHRFADVSPRKMHPLAQLVRGKNIDDAIEALRFYPNRGARLIEQVVKSAYGNADDKKCPNLESLVVTECRIDCGPMFKRIQPRARGTAFGIKKRLAHIIVTLSDPVAGEDQRNELVRRLAATAPEVPAPTEQPTPAASN